MTTKGLSSGLAQTKSIYFRAKPPAMMLNTPRQPVIFSLALHYISSYLTPKKKCLISWIITLPGISGQKNL